MYQTNINTLFIINAKKDHNAHFSLDYRPQLTALLFLSHPYPFVFLPNTYYDFFPFQTLFCFDLSTVSVFYKVSMLIVQCGVYR